MVADQPGRDRAVPGAPRAGGGAAGREPLAVENDRLPRGHRLVAGAAGAAGDRPRRPGRGRAAAGGSLEVHRELRDRWRTVQRAGGPGRPGARPGQRGAGGPAARGGQGHAGGDRHGDPAVRGRTAHPDPGGRAGRAGRRTLSPRPGRRGCWPRVDALLAELQAEWPAGDVPAGRRGGGAAPGPQAARRSPPPRSPRPRSPRPRSPRPGARGPGTRGPGARRPGNPRAPGGRRSRGRRDHGAAGGRRAPLRIRALGAATVHRARCPGDGGGLGLRQAARTAVPARRRRRR